MAWKQRSCMGCVNAWWGRDGDVQAKHRHILYNLIFKSYYLHIDALAAH